MNDICYSFKVKTNQQKRKRKKKKLTLKHKTSRLPESVRRNLFIFQSSRLFMFEREPTGEPVN